MTSGNAEENELASFISAMGADRALRVEENLGSGFVRLRVAEAERRQARHDVRTVEDAVLELLRNSRDAGARNIYVATSREAELRTIVVIDDGDGIPEDMQDRVFEPRVTSKLESVHMDRWGIHGRGMALYAIRENAAQAYVACSAPGLGCSLVSHFDTAQVSERADQSSWPSLGTDEEGSTVVTRGPRNIARTCAEFALEEHGRLEVYLGSPAEIVATARFRVRLSRGRREAVGLGRLELLGALERIHAAADAHDLMEAAASVGIMLSERTCRRIITAEIKPLRSVYSRLGGSSTDHRRTEPSLLRDRRRHRLSEEDAAAFARLMERDFDYIADRYYLYLTGSPTVRFTDGKLTVSFPFKEED